LIYRGSELFFTRPRGQTCDGVADLYSEEILEFQHDAWCRLFSTFRAVHGGVAHDRFNLPAYGGHLFDPDRFPFLEGRARDTSWRESAADPLPVNNRTVLHLLEALQFLTVKVPGGGGAEKCPLSTCHPTVLSVRTFCIFLREFSPFFGRRLCGWQGEPWS
jgi:hypothetical protein